MFIRALSVQRLTPFPLLFKLPHRITEQNGPLTMLWIFQYFYTGKYAFNASTHYSYACYKGSLMLLGKKSLTEGERGLCLQAAALPAGARGPAGPVSSTSSSSSPALGLDQLTAKF